MIKNKPTVQGRGASRIFEGKGKSTASIKLYSESSKFFAQIIKQKFPVGNYVLVDLGSFKGEFLKNILKEINEYSFYKVGVDRDEIIKDNIIVDESIISDLNKIPLDDNYSDITLVRYVLNWNLWDKQKEIIDEIYRITKRICIIQHIGPDNKKIDSWRKNFDKLFSGEKIRKLKRNDYYFSSRDEIESHLKESNINFERVQGRKINNVFDALSERFNLSVKEYNFGKELLESMNYVIQTTWIIYK